MCTRLALSISLALLAANFPVPATAEPGIVTMTGSTFVRGESGLTSMMVRVPPDTTMDGTAWNNPAIDFHGGNGIVAVVLASQASDKPLRIVSSRWWCSPASCEPTQASHITVFLKGKRALHRKRHTVPAGLYRLSIVSEEGAVTAEITLDGLSGTTQVTPDDERRVVLGEPKATYDPAPNRTLYRAWQHVDLPSKGFALVSERTSHVGAYTYGHCIYRGNRHPENQLDPTLCETEADSWGRNTGWSLLPGIQWTIHSLHILEPGRWSAAYHHTAAGYTRNYDLLTAWIPF